MNWEAMGAIGDFVSGIGVIVTLGYLAVQIRSSTNLVRGQAQRERDRNVGSQFFISRELLGALTKIQEKDGFDEVCQVLMDEYALTPEEGQLWMRHLLQVWGGFRADYSMGTLDEKFVSRMLSRRDQRMFWDMVKQDYDPAFVRRIGEIDARRT